MLFDLDIILDNIEPCSSRRSKIPDIWKPHYKVILERSRFRPFRSFFNKNPEFSEAEPRLNFWTRSRTGMVGWIWELNYLTCN